MADSLVGTIEGLSVYAVQLPHAQGQIGIGRLDDGVIVVVQQTKGMTKPIVLPYGSGQGNKKCLPICIRKKDVRLCIPTRGYTVYRAGIFDS